MSIGALETFKADGRPVVVIVRAPLFNASEGFIQAQAAGLRHFQPLFVGLEDKGNVFAELAGRRLFPDGRREALIFKAIAPPAALVERIRRFAPVVVHAHFGTDGVLALPLANALGLPLVTTLHGYDVGRSRLNLLASGRLSWMRYALAAKRLMRTGDLFLPVSDALRERAVGRGFPQGRTKTHYLGIDTKRFSPERATPEPGLILHVGRLVEKKGTAFLIDALRQLPPPARLIVIGDGPLRAALERHAADLEERVQFLGSLPREEVMHWFRRAWALAVPSVIARDGDCEGLPTVLLEAAACGVPAVGSRHSGIPEAIADGESGFLIPERDVEALSRRLAEIIASPDLRHRLGRGARSLVERNFDSECQTDRLEQFYADLAAPQVEAGSSGG
jgi:colanic acid/amylovoran biosynthesis glycosyltransferase